MANGANIEHRDKKGCTPLVLAASAGHAVTVAILLDHNADIEAQTDRTKDTALSLACSGGRQEVGVERVCRATALLVLKSSKVFTHTIKCGSPV